MVPAVGPESVEVRGLEGPLSAGRPHKVVCEARGSRPPAILTWFLDGHMKKSQAHTVRAFVDAFVLDASCVANHFHSSLIFPHKLWLRLFKSTSCLKRQFFFQTSLDGLVSSSTLELVASTADEGAKLTCRAENPALPGSSMEDLHQLQVLCECGERTHRSFH